MKSVFRSKLLEFRLGDVRDIETMKGCFKSVDYIFHAAALKHVPSFEFFSCRNFKNKYTRY